MTDKLLNVTCRYRICSDVTSSLDREPSTLYGIEAVSEDDVSMVYESVKAISGDRLHVDRMITKFNQFHLLPIHLRDAVEDMMD